MAWIPFEFVAAIADGLASLFGQPLVFVDMYLKPPNFLGLACRWNDHGVSVPTY